MANEVMQKLRENIARVMVGRERTIDLLLTALAAGGHVLVEDVPGTGKTMMARSLAASASLAFSRIQCTPDRLPSDVTGLNYFNQEKGAFVFRGGPVFTSILLADEINRATPRTQSALLECMEERQVTVDGETRKLPAPFFVIATQNPVETLGTFELPEAQLDRFLMRICMGAMTQDEEVSMIDRFIEETPLETLTSVVSAEEVLGLQQTCRKVYVHPDLRGYIAALLQATRSVVRTAAGERCIGEGVSPRGTLALVRASQGFALLKGRGYVTPEDIRAVGPSVLTHRFLSRSASSAQEKEARIAAAVSSVPVPTEDWGR